MSAEQPILITTAWAHGTNLLANIVYPTDTPSNVIANQFDGFPPGQEADPTAGGEYVKRAEMNGVFKLYSLLLNYINQGGQFTINPNVIAQGGYDLGVILYCASNNTMQRSLMNANTANFVANSSYINDGVHWRTFTSMPDIQDNTITGNVVIGNRINDSASSIISNHSWGYNTIVNDQSSSRLNIVLSNGISAECAVQSNSGLGTTASLFAFLGIFESNSTAFNIGISMTYGNRPVLQGNYLTCTSAPQSILTFGDIPNIQDNTITGNVIIGNRVLGASNVLQTLSSTPALSGSISFISTQNDYTYMGSGHPNNGNYQALVTTNITAGGTALGVQLGTYLIGTGYLNGVAVDTARGFNSRPFMINSNIAPLSTDDLACIGDLNNRVINKYYSDASQTITVSAFKLGDGTWAGSVSGVVVWGLDFTVQTVDLTIDMNPLVGVQNFIQNSFGTASGRSGGGQTSGLSRAFASTSSISVSLSWLTPVSSGTVYFSLTFRCSNIT